MSTSGGFAENRGADRAAVREARLLLDEVDSEAYDGRMCEVIRMARSALRVLGTELERLGADEETVATGVRYAEEFRETYDEALEEMSETDARERLRQTEERLAAVEALIGYSGQPPLRGERLIPASALRKALSGAPMTDTARIEDGTFFRPGTSSNPP